MTFFQALGIDDSAATPEEKTKEPAEDKTSEPAVNNEAEVAEKPVQEEKNEPPQENTASAENPTPTDQPTTDL